MDKIGGGTTDIVAYENGLLDMGIEEEAETNGTPRVAAMGK